MTGLAWALFGLVAGALYGLWAGRGVSAARLRGLRPLLTPDTSMVAWADETATQRSIGAWSTPASQQLILRFASVRGGAVLEV